VEAVEGDSGVVDARFATRHIWELLQVVRDGGSRMLTRVRVAARIMRFHRVHVQTGRPTINELQDATVRTTRTMEEAEKIKKFQLNECDEMGALLRQETE